MAAAAAAGAAWQLQGSCGSSQLQLPASGAQPEAACCAEHAGG
jgi:hypothetical protein